MVVISYLVSLFRYGYPARPVYGDQVVLVTLASQPKRVLSRMQIMEQAQGTAFEGYERTIDAHIKNIRIKMEPNPKKPVYIKTVFGLGYKFEIDSNA